MRPAIVFVTVLMTQFSISALNEWADRDRDAAANRRRPVAMGRLRPELALAVGLLFGLAAIPGALSFGPLSLLIVLAGLGIGWLYDLVLKPTPLSFLPFACAFPLLPVWTGLVAGRPLPGLLVFFIAGAPLAVAIHLADSMPDIGKDASAGIRTLAVALGPGRSVAAMQLTLLLGSLVVVKTLVYRLPMAISLAGVALAGAWLAAKTAAEHSVRTRWVVTATVLALVIPWIAVRL